MKPSIEYVHFTARSDFEWCLKMTATFFIGCCAWVYHLGGWTITLYRNGEPFIVLKEWW